MAISTGSVDGLVSGMDTANIIEQLISLERTPQTRLQFKKARGEAKIAAYQLVNARFGALQSAADKLGKADTWKAFKVTSSSTGVSATASTNALTGNHTFEVLALAKAHATFEGGTYASTAQQITGAASITITKNGVTSAAIDIGDGSMASVVSAVNASNAGVKAAAVQVAPGQYRLSLTSTTTGDDSAFSVDGAALGASSLLVTGADARIGMGDKVGGVYPVEISSASNTFADVLPGVTFTVSKLETVTLDVAINTAGVASSVKAMVDAANDVLDEIAKHTAYSAETKKSSILTGDPTLRSLQQRLLNLVSGSSMGEAGVELTRTGRLTFDQAAFEKAYKDDSAATAELFRPGGDMAPPTAAVSFVAAGDQAQAGSYAVEVTREAEAATLRSTIGVLVDGEELAFRLPGGDPVTVALVATDDATTIATKINTASAANGLGLVAADEGGVLVVRSAAFGAEAAVEMTTTSAGITTTWNGARLEGTIEGTESIQVTATSGSFSVAAQVGDTLATLATRINSDAATAGVSVLAKVVNGKIVLEPPFGHTVQSAVTGGTGLLDAYAAGVDVAGSIDGVAGEGNGRILTIPSSVTRLAGLALEVGEGAGTGALGTFTYAPGLAQRMDSFAGDAIRSGTGQLATVIDGGKQQITDYDAQIRSWDVRIELKELSLRRQFANLETTLGRLRDQSSWLAGQLAGLVGGSAS